MGGCHKSGGRRNILCIHREIVMDEIFETVQQWQQAMFSFTKAGWGDWTVTICDENGEPLGPAARMEMVASSCKIYILVDTERDNG
jgi:hypothetical protein